MFKFSSTHVINSNKDFYVNDKATDGQGESVSEGSFVVGANAKFYKENVTKIRKATPVEAQTEIVKVTVPALTADALCRLYLYVRSVDNADPLYANDWIYKGKPFSIEFKAGSSAAASAANIVKNANKWINFVFGKKVIKVTNSSADVTLEVVSDTDLRFYKIEIQEFVPATASNDYAASYYADGGFETKAGWSASSQVEYDTELEVEVTQAGNSGFGTSNYLLKNLRLPTNANTGFMSINQMAEEMPVAGGKYTQYIITQCTERPEVQGISVIGQYNKSITTHVLWVLDSAVSAVEAGLAKVYEDDIEVYPEDEVSTSSFMGDTPIETVGD